GPAGCWASDGGDLLDQPAMPVVVVDPVGAGDAFAAGLLSSVLDGADLAQAVLAGAAVGARCVQAAGDLAGLPTRVELDQLLGGYRDHISR
ncbi:MAG TPA: carbohydrate kinase family protein, partial [Desertimonas sp.]|nr:carbohydrate kinase family protein [Desertimonas sp.]